MGDMLLARSSYTALRAARRQRLASSGFPLLFETILAKVFFNMNQETCGGAAMNENILPPLDTSRCTRSRARLPLTMISRMSLTIQKFLVKKLCRSGPRCAPSTRYQSCHKRAACVHEREDSVREGTPTAVLSVLAILSLLLLSGVVVLID